MCLPTSSSYQRKVNNYRNNAQYSSTKCTHTCRKRIFFFYDILITTPAIVTSTGRGASVVPHVIKENGVTSNQSLVHEKIALYAIFFLKKFLIF